MKLGNQSNQIEDFLNRNYDAVLWFDPINMQKYKDWTGYDPDFVDIKKREVIRWASQHVSAFWLNNPASNQLVPEFLDLDKLREPLLELETVPYEAPEPLSKYYGAELEIQAVETI